MDLSDSDHRGDNDPKIRKAAQYVRMSTEHLRYLTENQSDAIGLYAKERGYQIIQTYSDAGKSGLRIEGRDGLTQLLADIQAGRTDFNTVLVYTSAAGVGFRMLMKALIMNTSASVQVYQSSIAPSSLRMTVVLFQPSLRGSNVRWRASTAVSCRKRSLLVNLG